MDSHRERKADIKNRRFIVLSVISLVVIYVAVLVPLFLNACVHDTRTSCRVHQRLVDYERDKNKYDVILRKRSRSTLIGLAKLINNINNTRIRFTYNYIIDIYKLDYKIVIIIFKGNTIV